MRPFESRETVQCLGDRRVTVIRDENGEHQRLDKQRRRDVRPNGFPPERKCIAILSLTGRGHRES